MFHVTTLLYIIYMQIIYFSVEILSVQQFSTSCSKNPCTFEETNMRNGELTFLGTLNERILIMNRLQTTTAFFLNIQLQFLNYKIRQQRQREIHIDSTSDIRTSKISSLFAIKFVHEINRLYIEKKIELFGNFMEFLQLDRDFITLGWKRHSNHLDA